MVVRGYTTRSPRGSLVQVSGIDTGQDITGTLVGLDRRDSCSCFRSDETTAAVVGLPAGTLGIGERFLLIIEPMPMGAVRHGRYRLLSGNLAARNDALGETIHSLRPTGV